MPQPKQNQPVEEEIVVDGETIDLDDFSFREQRELKRVLKDDILEEPDADVDIDDLALSEFLPAAIFVWKRRTDPNYTVDAALDLKYRDVVRQKTANGNGAGPTKAKATKGG
jgi:hypothetical protein